jgi:uncharacterized membrane protein YfcA
LITDPYFYLAAVPGVLLFGISKGGFGGGLGFLTVPLMALAVTPAQAAAIMLPILMVMDIGAVWVCRNTWDRSLMKVLLPAGLLGIAIGMLSFRWFSVAGLKLLLGVIALGFILHRWRRRTVAPSRPSALKGVFWTSIAGVTTFVAHAGVPAVNVYLLPLRLRPAIYVGTVTILFAALNYAKVIPYWWLGLFDGEILATSLALVPLGLLSIWAGFLLRGRLSEKLFYRIVYTLLAITGAKMLYDGVRGLA